MAGAFEQPLFFSGAMFTTSSRLQHLDSHFCLQARLPRCRRVSSKPPVDRTHSSPSRLLCPPPKNVKRSPSRSSTSSDGASFRTAISNADKEGYCENKTPGLLTDGQESTVEVEKAQPLDTTANGPGGLNCVGAKHTTYLARIPITKRIKELPERSSTTNRSESSHLKLNPRRTSTVSEPMPRFSIPRRTSSTPHRRQRKGQDLISFHRDSCRLFQSLEGTLSANRRESRPMFGRYYSMPGSPSTSFDATLDMASIQEPTNLTEVHSQDQEGAYSGGEIPEHVLSTESLPVSVEIESTPSPMRHTSATVMSWTTAETRKRDYEKIDQAHSGVRGLWKKLTPKWCHGRNSRRKFYEGRCDGDSVRRVRLEMPDLKGQ